MLPVIVCGGAGTRLWPLSRAHFPKPFCHLIGEPLFEQTAQRLKVFGDPWVVTGRNLKTLTEFLSYLMEIKRIFL